MSFLNHPKSNIITFLLATFTLCNAYADLPVIPVITDANWGIMNTTFPPGTNGKINGIVKYGNSIYVCGKFTSAGGINAVNVAKWNGLKWSSLGYETGDADNEISALCADRVGNIYVGEAYWGEIPGGFAALFKLKKWDGVEWHQCNTGNRGFIKSISADSAGNIYVAGRFDTVGGVPAKNIAKWNGNHWDSLQSGLYTPEQYPTVNVLAIDNSGILYAGGDFTYAGGLPVQSIAKWDGSKWDSLQSLPSATILAIAFNKKGDPYVGGDIFDVRPGIKLGINIVRWNGSQWDSVGSGTEYIVSTLCFDSSDNLYAGGLTYHSGGPYDVVKKWDGSNWLPLNIMTAEELTSISICGLVTDNDGKLFACGEFIYAGNERVNNIASFNESKWSALGTGFDGCINDLTFDGSGNLYAAGEFTTISTDEDSACGIAKWNGNTWSAMGSGTGSVYTSSNAIAIDHSNNVFASISNGGIIKWDGNAWINAGLKNNTTDINAIVVDDSGFLYSTYFSTLSTTSWSQYITKWDGSRWMNIGSKFNGSVYSLAIDNESCLYAGGQFDTIWGATISESKSNISKITKWDGEKWIDIGAQLGKLESINVLLFDKKGNLYAGGFFDSTGGKPASNIAIWNGTAWSGIGAGVDSTVKALALDSSGKLYAGGDFHNAGGVSANHIARWDGKEWSALGSGTDNSVNALAVHKYSLYVGGEFMNAGDKFTPYIARIGILPGVNISSKHPINNSIELHCRIVNRMLYTSNVLPQDKFLVYSLSGRLLRQYQGTPAIHLGGFSPQILFIFIVRDGKIILNDRILLH